MGPFARTLVMLQWKDIADSQIFLTRLQSARYPSFIFWLSCNNLQCPVKHIRNRSVIPCGGTIIDAFVIISPILIT